MSRALIQTSNQSSQTVANNSIISLGSVLRRFGCNLRLSGNAIEVNGEGYYTIDADVTVAPSVAGIVTAALYKNGTQIPGAIARGSVSTAENPVTLCVNTTIRQACCCDSADNITCVLILPTGTADTVTATVSNISVRIVKE